MPLVGTDGKRYDCSFLDADGHEVGLLLTRNKDGALNYLETTDTALASQYASGEVGYTNFEPEKKVRVGQSDWTQGFGAEFYDEEKPKRYYYSIGADARFKNRVILGPKVTNIALTDYSFTFTDGGLEVWTDASTLTNWTNSTATVAREATIIYAGTYSAKLSGTTDGYVYQDPAWNNKYRGTQVTVTAYIYNTTVGNARGQILITDDAGTTTTSSTGSGAWAQFTCTRTIGAAATYFRVALKYDYIGTGSAAVYFDKVEVGSPIFGQVRAWAEFDDNLYMGYGDILVKLNATGDGWTFIKSFAGALIMDLEPFEDNLYIGFLTPLGSVYYYMDTSEACTASTLAGVKGQGTFFCAIGDTLKKTVYNTTVYQYVYSATDPTNTGDWDTGTVVGGSMDFFTSKPVEQGGLPILPRTDMPYYIDDVGTAQHLLPALSALRQNTAGRGTINWQGNIYYPLGALLYEHSADGTVTDISPSEYIQNDAEFEGHVVALSGDAQYLYAVIGNSTYIEILAGRWETIDGRTDWVWHSLQQITMTGTTAYLLYPIVCHVSSIYKNRLYVSSTVASEGVNWVPLTDQYGNIQGDTDYLYLTGGYIVTPYLYCNARDDKKAWVKITLVMEDTTANIYWRAYYQKLGDTTWTEINDVLKFKTSPTTTAYIPVDLTNASPQSTMMRFKFEGVTNTTATSPVLLGYDVRGVWYPPQETIIQIQAKCSDRDILHGGGHEESQSSASISTAISELANPSTAYPRAFYPPYWKNSTDTKYVKLLSPSQKRMVKDETTRNEEWVYDLSLLVVPLS